MRNPRISVTGLGVVSPLGLSAAPFWQALCDGRNGIKPITRFELEGCPYDVGGQVTDFDSQPPEDCGMSLGAQFALETARQALADIPEDMTAGVGLVMATNFGPSELIEHSPGGGNEPGSMAYRMRNGFFAEDMDRVATRLGIGGPRACISLSCASGNAAIAHAVDMIRLGRAGAVLAVGYDSIQRMSWAGLSCLRVMARGTDNEPPRVRPFDAHRGGTIFSEGAGCLLLQSEDSVEKTGANAMAHVVGVGVNNNAYHLTHADKEGAGTAVAMEMALADAALEPGVIDHFNAHGTGTKLNDVIETRAMYRVFGPRAARLPTTSNKGGLGHGMGAASSWEAVCSVQSLLHSTIPPTQNLEEQDPECDLDVVAGEPRQVDMRYAMSNSAGIGGSNAAVIFERASTRGES